MALLVGMALPLRPAVSRSVQVGARVRGPLGGVPLTAWAVAVIEGRGLRLAGRDGDGHRESHNRLVGETDTSEEVRHPPGAGTVAEIAARVRP